MEEAAKRAARILQESRADVLKLAWGYTAMYGPWELGTDPKLVDERLNALEAALRVK